MLIPTGTQTSFLQAMVRSRDEGAGCRARPLCFLSGFLFSADIGRVYETLCVPVWVVHGTRGNFVDYHLKDVLALRSRWSFNVMQTGALPYLEQPQAFLTAWGQFRTSARSAS